MTANGQLLEFNGFIWCKLLMWIAGEEKWTEDARTYGMQFRHVMQCRRIKTALEAGRRNRIYATHAEQPLSGLANVANQH